MFIVILILEVFGSEIIPPKRRRIRIIESESKDSLEDLDEWLDVTEKLDILEITINSYTLYKTVQRNKNEKILLIRNVGKC